MNALTITPGQPQFTPPDQIQSGGNKVMSYGGPICGMTRCNENLELKSTIKTFQRRRSWHLSRYVGVSDPLKYELGG